MLIYLHNYNNHNHYMRLPCRSRSGVGLSLAPRLCTCCRESLSDRWSRRLRPGAEPDPDQPGASEREPWSWVPQPGRARLDNRRDTSQPWKYTANAWTDGTDGRRDGCVSLHTSYWSSILEGEHFRGCIFPQSVPSKAVPCLWMAACRPGRQLPQ